MCLKYRKNHFTVSLELPQLLPIKLTRDEVRSSLVFTPGRCTVLAAECDGCGEFGKWAQIAFSGFAYGNMQGNTCAFAYPLSVISCNVQNLSGNVCLGMRAET